jgi:hypothetical protein
MSKQKVTYGDYGLPFYGAIYNRDLHFPNPYFNVKNNNNEISLKNVINPRMGNVLGGTNFKNKNNSFGSLWYPNMYIDLNYNSGTGGYSNGPMGPYFATGLGNYPNSIYKEVHYGTQKKLPKKNKKNPKAKKK